MQETRGLANPSLTKRKSCKHFNTAVTVKSSPKTENRASLFDVFYEQQCNLSGRIKEMPRCQKEIESVPFIGGFHSLAAIHSQVQTVLCKQLSIQGSPHASAERPAYRYIYF